MNDFKHEVASTEEQYGSPTYAWYVVVILLFAYVTSFLDRTILTLLVEPIRESSQYYRLAIKPSSWICFCGVLCFSRRTYSAFC